MGPFQIEWQDHSLAAEKLPEIEAQVEHTLGMKRLLERGLRCDCLRLEDCTLLRDEDSTAAREKVGPS